MNPNKRVVPIFFAILILCLFCVSSFAKEETVCIKVTLADGNGNIVFANKELNVEDADSDGVITVNDALVCLHRLYYNEGEIGYNANKTPFGLTPKKVWGEERENGAFAFYRNSTYRASLLFELCDSDTLDIYVLQDELGFGDIYSFFDRRSVSAKQGEEISLRLLGVSYDDNYNRITVPIKDAVIVLDGNATELVTDSDGYVSLSFDDERTHIVSVKAKSGYLMPAACIVNGGINTVSPALYKSNIPAWAVYSLVVISVVFCIGVLLMPSLKKE